MMRDGIDWRGIGKDRQDEDMVFESWTEKVIISYAREWFGSICMDYRERKHILGLGKWVGTIGYLYLWGMKDDGNGRGKGTKGSIYL